MTSSSVGLNLKPAGACAIEAALTAGCGKAISAGVAAGVQPCR